MSNYDNGFARAQRAYENQMPPEDEPELAKYKIEGSVVDSPANRIKLNSLFAYDVEVIGDNDKGEDIISFAIESDGEQDLSDARKEYNKTKLILQAMNARYDTDEFTELYSDE
jgi:hypothetical protein